MLLIYNILSTVYSHTVDIDRVISLLLLFMIIDTLLRRTYVENVTVNCSPSVNLIFPMTYYNRRK